jgi:hypothetical protein
MTGPPKGVETISAADGTPGIVKHLLDHAAAMMHAKAHA